MAKRRKKRQTNPLVKSMLMIAMFFASGFLIYSVYNEMQATNQLNMQISTAKQKEVELQEKKEQLAQDKVNLSNEEYLLKYARGKYLVTGEDGEQVFRLPDNNED